MQLHSCTTPAHLDAVASLLAREMYKDRDPAQLRAQMEEMRAEGYHWLAIIEENRYLAALNYHIGTRLYSGKYIRMDSMVVDPSIRNSGIGKLLLEWVINKGKEAGCTRIILDTYTENYGGHKFFHREGFHIRGYHMNRPL